MIKRILVAKPIYFLLLPLFFVLHGFTENFFLVPVKNSITLLSVYLLSAIVLYFLFRLIYKQPEKAAFLSFLVMAFNFFFGYIQDGLKEVFPGTFLIRYSFLLSIAFILFLGMGILLKKKLSISYRINTYFNFLFCILILIDSGYLVVKIFSLASRQEKVLIQPGIRQAKPDIYFIVADEYGGNKGLTEICNYDNTAFLNTLGQKGFFVAANSKSNYNLTTFSMASILNMDYLSLKKEQLEKADHTKALGFIYSNKVVSFLKDSGYTIYNYSIFDLKDQLAENKNAFVPFRTELLTSQTLVDRFKKDVWLNAAQIFNLRGVLRRSLYENLRYNQEIYKHSMAITRSQDSTPKFVYTHLEMPHFPYYYDSHSTLYPEEFLWKNQPGDTGTYIEYLKYTNQELLKLIDEILKKNRTPPVIILMSDHGYRCFPAGTVSHAFDNLFSVYFPGRNYNQFSDSMNNVNVFRATFNSIFNTKFPMLESKRITVND